MKKKDSTFILAASIIIASLIYAFTNRYIPSPVNESFIIDSWTGDIYDLQGNNLTKLHKSLTNRDFKNKTQPDKIQ